MQQKALFLLLVKGAERQHPKQERNEENERNKQNAPENAHGERDRQRAEPACLCSQTVDQGGDDTRSLLRKESAAQP